MDDDSALGIVGDIYDAALDGRCWSGVMSAVADFCGAANAALVVTDHRLGYSSVITPRADPAVVAAYGRDWWAHDPMVNGTSALPVGRLKTLDDTGRERFFDSPFYNEFWRHSGLGAERVAVNLVTNADAFVSCGLQTSPARDAISGDMYRRFSMFTPHLIRAAAIGRRLHRTKLERPADGADAQARIVVDAAARILFANAQADAMFAGESGLQAAGGTLTLADAGADRTLKAAIAACGAIHIRTAAGERVAFVHGHAANARRLIVDVAPYRRRHATGLETGLGGPPPVALLTVTDPFFERERQFARFQDRFGLTRAEAALAYEMLKGDGRAAAAARCGISINTARTHLTRIFDKTGVTRQAELVRVLTESQSPD